MAKQKTRVIHCCCCDGFVNARLTDGKEIYSHRPDLYSLPFWKCDSCGNFVGCHHKTKDRTRPLGVIPTIEMKTARKQIHAIIDPIWKNGVKPRGYIYAQLSKALGREYHTAELRTMQEAEKVIVAARALYGNNSNLTPI